MYYSKTNKSSYSTVLGKSYKTAKTEYGLRLAKLVLDKIQALDPARVLTSDEVQHIITVGDALFLANAGPQESSDGDIATAAIRVLEQFHNNIEEVEMELDQEEYRREAVVDDGMDWNGMWHTS
jgi:hypothetical protein